MKQYIIIAAAILFIGCGSKAKKQSNLTKAPKGDIMYGGVFKYNETEYYRSLYPLNITEVVGHRISTNIYEGLVKFSQKDLTIKPALAKSWHVEENATKFYFTVRDDVFFHDDACFKDGIGRKMKIEDIVYCLEKLCTYDPNNQGFWSVQGLIKGSDDFYNTSKLTKLESELINASDSVKVQIKKDIQELNSKLKNNKYTAIDGVKILNDTTLLIELSSPNAGFLQRLALPFSSIYPREAWEKYGTDMRDHAVGTGPFYVKKIEQDVTVILRKNPKYWGRDTFGNTLPYLDGVKISFIAEEKTELIEFTAGNLDMKYRLPLEMLDEIMDKNNNLKPAYQKFSLQKSGETSIQYYGFLHSGKIFNNKKLRQAINYAIDRQKLCDYTLKRQGIPTPGGIVPAGFSGFDYSKIKGYTFDPSKAKSLLAEAGYPGGKGLPPITLQINSGGGRNEAVAEAIQKMIEENLHIDINITQMVWAQHTENLETSKSDFFRLGWVADYPDPENFLNLLHSKHIPAKASDKAYINAFRYRNPTYDALYDKSLTIIDDKARNEIYQQLDQICVDDAVVMPIFCPISFRLIGSRVRNFPQNPIEYRSLEDVWVME